MKYIHPPFTEENITRQYKALALDFHPDKGGSDKLMQTLNLERDEALKLVGTTPKKRLSKKSKFYKVVSNSNGKKITLDITENHVAAMKEVNRFFRYLRK